MTTIVAIAALPFAGVDDSIRPDLYGPGVARAERFRRSLLQPVDGGRTRDGGLARAIVRFRDRSDRTLRGRGRPDLERFRGLDDRAIIEAIRGSRAPIDAGRAFGPFRGRWYGRWDGMEVDHDWSRIELFDPPEVPSHPDAPPIVARQSARIGDGFGWNVVARDAGGGEAILGAVDLVVGGDPGRVRLFRPHVGVDAGPGRLIWISGGEFFFEEVLPDDPRATRSPAPATDSASGAARSSKATRSRRSTPDRRVIGRRSCGSTRPARTGSRRPNPLPVTPVAAPLGVTRRKIGERRDRLRE